MHMCKLDSYGLQQTTKYKTIQVLKTNCFVFPFSFLNCNSKQMELMNNIEIIEIIEINIFDYIENIEILKYFSKLYFKILKN